MKNKKIIWVISALILFATFLSYCSSLNNQFTNYDDTVHFLERRDIRALNVANLRNIFTTTINRTYIPLTTLSFAIEYHLFGYNEFVYHLDNLLLHLGVTILVLIFFINVGVPLKGAAFAALLFGIHPIHVESVAWVTERKDVLYSFFYMLALVCYLSYLRRGSNGKYLLVFVFSLLSMLSKPMALSFPLILILCDVFYGRKIKPKILLEKAPFFLMTFLVVWKTYSLHARMPAIEFSRSLLVWIWTFVFYPVKFLFPVSLVPIYVLPEPISLFNLSYSFALIVFITVIVVLIRLRNNKYFTFAFFFYFLSIFFLFRFDNMADINIVADRFMYLPSLGFCLLIGCLLGEGIKRLKASKKSVRSIGYAAIVFFFLTLSWKTFNQCNVWKDSLTLWNFVEGVYVNSNAEKSPQLAIVYNNKGQIYGEQDLNELAVEYFNKASKVAPHISKTYNNRGNIYFKEEKYKIALVDFNKALAIDPEYSEAFLNRGLTYSEIGKHDLAISDFNSALRINPNYSEAYNNRGNVFSGRKQFGLALEDYYKAIEIDPTYLDVYDNLGVVYLKQGENDRAALFFSKAIEFNPENVKAYINRGSIRIKEKKYDLALEDLCKAIKIDPRAENGYINRGYLYQMRGDMDLALLDYEKVLDNNSKHAKIFHNRAIIYLSKKNKVKALADIEKARSLGYAVDKDLIKMIKQIK